MRTGRWSVGIALLMLTACQTQPEANDDDNVAAPVNAAPKAAADPAIGDEALRRSLIGSWVISKERPVADPADICATDNGIGLNEDGGYDSFSEAGHWAAKNGTLVITATLSLPDFDEPNGVETPIAPPRIEQWPVEAVDGDLARIRIENETFWMFRCPEISHG